MWIEIIEYIKYICALSPHTLQHTTLRIVELCAENTQSMCNVFQDYAALRTIFANYAHIMQAIFPISVQ